VGFVAETFWVRAENAGLAVTTRPAPQAEACGYPEVAGVAFGLQRSTGLRALDSQAHPSRGGIGIERILLERLAGGRE
jgi:hypothetical protein